jgi:hypothetical protein
LQGVCGEERNLRKFFLQVFIDDRRLIDHAVTVNEHGDFGVRVEFEQVFGLVLEVDFQEFVRDFLFGKDNPCPMSIGSGMG